MPNVLNADFRNTFEQHEIDFAIIKHYPNYKDFSIARRAQTDQMIQQKHGGLIAKLSKRLLVPLRKMEKEKVKRARLAKQAKK